MADADPWSDARGVGVVLEPLLVEHAAAMVAVLADPAIYSFTGGDPPSLDDLEHRYHLQSRGLSPDGTERWFNWIVRDAVSRDAVGYVQATVTRRDQLAELAWVVGAAWQGRGYAAAAATAMVAELRPLGLRGLFACVHPEHEASQRVAARIGLVATDEIRDGEVVWRGPA